MPNIINQYGQVKVGVRTQAGGITPLLLDTYSGASAAYSLRKLRTAYSGYAIRVRRSSDNAEQNIGFTSTGGLDTTSLLAFVGAGNGFVTTWYDQGASGYNLTQSIASNQPSIVLSGVLNTQNNKPILITDFNSYMFNDSVPINGTTNSIFATIKMVTTRGNISIMSGYNVTYNQHFVSRNTNGNNRYYDSNSDITASPLPNGLNLIGIHENSSGVTVYENGANLVTNFAHDVNNTIGIMIFRRNVNANEYMPNGSGFSELVIYGNSSKLSDNSGISANINTYYSIYSSDADAQAFITAAGITDTTQKSAINTLVTSLKSANIWTKMKAIYPFVGGTATSHKFNLKDPRDLDVAFRLGFYGGWAHSSNGVTPNGTNGYADTYLTPNTSLSLLNQHISFYSRTNSAGGVDIAAGESATTIQIWGSTLYYDVSSGGYKTVSVSNSTGLIMAQRLNYVNNVFKNNSKIKTDNLGSYEGFLPSTTIELSRVRTGGYYSNKNLAFATIGNAMSDAEALAFYTAVQAYQTTLGRQV